MATTYTEFGPDVPPAELPPDFLECLPPAAPSTACDLTVGSLASGLGYCGQVDPASGEAITSPVYAQMTYCACVNNAAPCPEYTSAVCANSAFAYRPHAWYASPSQGESYDANCQNTPICVNLVEVGGDQNVVSGLTQQCGTFETLQLVIGANPALALVAFFLILVIAGLLLARTERPRGKLPPPPTPGLLAYFASHPPPR